MKELKIKDLERINGGAEEPSGRECFLRGLGVIGGIAAGTAGYLPGFAASWVILVTSSDCW